MLSASLFSALLGEYLPGHGAIYLSQTLQFTKPVYPGDKVVASVTVININNNKKQVTLKCEAKVGDKLVIKGEAVALAPSRGEN
jgi:3-hydroxybutyryl-CoA dehydratase